MTSAVSSCAVTLVCTLVVCAVLKIFAPSEKTVKTTSMVLGLFLLVSMTSPVISAFNELKSASFAVSDEVLDDTEEKISNEVLKETGDYINTYAGKLLDSLEISHNDLETVVENSSQSGIIIKSISIYLDEDQVLHEKKIKDAIMASLCVEPQLIYREE